METQEPSQQLSIVIAGAAGQGIQTVERVALRLLKGQGFHVYSTKSYMSRVRGGTSNTVIRVGNHRMQGFCEHMDILVPFSSESLDELKSRITADTLLLLDNNLVKDGTALPGQVHRIPLMKTAKEAGSQQFVNTVAAGMLAGLLGLPMVDAQREISRLFNRKGDSVVEKNLTALAAGYRIGESLPPSARLSGPVNEKGVQQELAINGAQAVGLGAIAGGCNMIASYPMSPGTGVLTFLSAKAEDFGIVAEQVEDEIAAINMALGGWFGGGGAMVTTSGGGFALMEEGVSLGAMTETPIVIHVAQRPGPATGLATRTEQADLDLVLYAGHGEFPRIILAPGTLSEGIQLSRHAFEMADRFQVPVFILTDQYYIDTYYNIPDPEHKPADPERYVVEADMDYKRYAFTDSGISPRAVPGFGSGVVVVSGNEHLEDGHITEDPQIRVRMNDKRLGKVELLEKEAIEPAVWGSETAETVVVCWGSTGPTVKEALQDRLHAIQLMHISQPFPLHPDAVVRLRKAGRIIVVEQNATGQLARLLRGHYGIHTTESVRKYDGRAMSVEFLQKKLLPVLDGGQS